MSFGQVSRIVDNEYDFVCRQVRLFSIDKHAIHIYLEFNTYEWMNQSLRTVVNIYYELLHEASGEFLRFGHILSLKQWESKSTLGIIDISISSTLLRMDR